MDDGLRYPGIWRVLAVGWLALIVYLSLTPAPPQPPGIIGWDKAQHALAYAFLGWWFAQAWPRRPWQVVIALVVIGSGLESLQGLETARTMDWQDALANTLGAGVGVALTGTWLGRCFAGVEAVLVPRG